MRNLMLTISFVFLVGCGGSSSNTNIGSEHIDTETQRPYINIPHEVTKTTISIQNNIDLNYSDQFTEGIGDGTYLDYRTFLAELIDSSAVIEVSEKPLSCLDYGFDESDLHNKVVDDENNFVTIKSYIRLYTDKDYMKSCTQYDYDRLSKYYGENNLLVIVNEYD